MLWLEIYVYGVLLCKKKKKIKKEDYLWSVLYKKRHGQAGEDQEKGVRNEYGAKGDVTMWHTDNLCTPKIQTKTRQMEKQVLGH